MGVWHKYDNADNSMAKKGEKAENDTAPKKAPPMKKKG